MRIRAHVDGYDQFLLQRLARSAKRFGDAFAEFTDYPGGFCEDLDALLDNCERWQYFCAEQADHPERRVDRGARVYLYEERMGLGTLIDFDGAKNNATVSLDKWGGQNAYVCADMLYLPPASESMPKEEREESPTPKGEGE